MVDAKRVDRDRSLRVRIIATGETKTLPYRQAVGLLSLQRAELVKGRNKKADVSPADADVLGVQDGAKTGNKPSSGAPSNDGRD